MEGALPNGGIVLVLWGYSDESGTDGQLHHTVISGFVAPLSEWASFREEWSRGLASDSVGHFHYIDCNNRSKGYADWNKNQSLPHLDKMAEILARQKVVAISVAHSGDYVEVLSRFPDWQTRFPSAYSLCFELLINQLRTQIYTVHNFELAIIMSEQNQFSPRALEVYQSYKGAGLWPEIVHLGYASPLVASPLQAADMLAYETRRFCWKEDEDYWKSQPFLKRWLDPKLRHLHPTYDTRMDDAGLEEFFSQEKGALLN